MSFISVSGNLEGFDGTFTQGSVTFLLTNYGDNLPRVLGSWAIAPIQQTFHADAGGHWGGTVIGNDIIDPGANTVPPTTYYSVTFADANGKVIQSLPFQFTGSGPVSLNSYAPMVTLPAVVPPPSTAALVAGNNNFTGTNTFTGTTVFNNVTLLNFQGPAAPITGTGAAATYFTYTLPANTLASGKGIRVTSVTRHSTGSSGSCLMSLSFGGTSTTAMGDDASATTAITKMVYEIFNNASTSAQVIVSDLTRGAAGTSFCRFDTSSVATTSSVVINVQFNVAATDAITPEMFMVELIQ